MTTRPFRTKVIVVGASVLFALVLVEIGIRLMVQPSARSWGQLAGFELPPLRLLPARSVTDFDQNAPYEDLVVDGRRITLGDLSGLVRDDDELGYAPLEHAVSANGWWQSNNIGARSRVDTTADSRDGLRRILVFGESFTAGYGVRQEESWPYLLNQRTTAVEVVNLAVSGYSMGQAYLRYRQIRSRVAHDIVLLAFVPREDLIREVNTVRALIGWSSWTVMPRFVFENRQLQLVPSPYPAEDLRRAVASGNTERLERHLRRYDRAFFPDAFAVPPLVGRLSLYKVVARLIQTRRFRRLGASMLDSDSEAIQIAGAIFDEMSAEVRARGQRFALVFIPNLRDVQEYQRSDEYGHRWHRIVERCPSTAVCIDLLEGFPDPRDLDFGYDGTHWGPRAQAWIAHAVAEALREKNFQ